MRLDTPNVLTEESPGSSAEFKNVQSTCKSKSLLLHRIDPILLHTPNDIHLQFFDCLLNEIQVVGTPGVGFGENGDGYFRFTTFGDTEDTKIAAERLEKLLGEMI